MSGAAYYIQECPICGRHLRVRVAYLGRQVACMHCGGKFEACDPESANFAQSSASGLKLLERANELLETASRQQRPQSA